MNRKKQTNRLTQYVDCKSMIHHVKHSVMFTNEEELKDKIIGELYRIFTH